MSNRDILKHAIVSIECVNTGRPPLTEQWPAQSDNNVLVTLHFLESWLLQKCVEGVVIPGTVLPLALTGKQLGDGHRNNKHIRLHLDSMS